MAVRMLVLYDLLPGVAAEEFAEWSRVVDQPACRAKPACHGFEVLIVERQEGAGPRFQVIEDIRADSSDAWAQAIASPEHTPVMEEWGRYGDPASVLTLQVRDSRALE